MKIIVLHGGYGCESGCCGHWVEIDGKQQGRFEFSHPYDEDVKAFVRRLVTEACGEEHVKDIDWEHCITSED